MGGAFSAPALACLRVPVLLPLPLVAASVAAVGAADVLPRRAHNEQQEKHEFTS